MRLHDDYQHPTPSLVVGVTEQHPPASSAVSRAVTAIAFDQGELSVVPFAEKLAMVKGGSYFTPLRWLYGEIFTVPCICSLFLTHAACLVVTRFRKHQWLMHVSMRLLHIDRAAYDDFLCTSLHL